MQPINFTPRGVENESEKRYELGTMPSRTVINRNARERADSDKTILETWLRHDTTIVESTCTRYSNGTAENILGMADAEGMPRHGRTKHSRKMTALLLFVIATGLVMASAVLDATVAKANGTQMKNAVDDGTGRGERNHNHNRPRETEDGAEGEGGSSSNMNSNRHHDTILNGEPTVAADNR